MWTLKGNIRKVNKMNTIKKLSSNGFMLDEYEQKLALGYALLKNRWFTVDSFKILKSKTFKYPFENLKVGNVLDGLKFAKGKDGKEYVIDYIVINHNDIEVKGNTNSPLLCTVSTTNNSLHSSPSSVNTSTVGCDTLGREGESLNPQFKAVSPSVQDNKPKCVNKYILKKFPNYEFRDCKDTCDLCGYPCVPREEKKNPIQDPIKYTQCVNIAFNMLVQKDLDYKIDGEYFWIKKAFNQADEIYKEFNKRCSR